jgi:hypothetical protein
MDAPKVDQPITGDGASTREQTRLVVMGLQRTGLSKIQAGNLAALASGLAPTASGWSIAEIDSLQFVRWLVDQGRLGS